MRHDLFIVLRGIARTPLTALLAIVAVCVGVAVTTSIFTVAHGVLLRGLPYPDSDRLMLVWRGSARDAGERAPLSPPDFLDVSAQATSFSAVAAVNSFSTTYVPEAGDPSQVQLGVVTGDFFRVMGVPPLLGRTLELADDRPLDTRDAATISVVVLDHAFWTRAFGADREVVGRTIEMGGSRMQVVGVMPASFRLHMPAGAGMSTELVGWTPLGIDYASAPRDGAYLKLIARLAPHATPNTAQAELDGIARRLRERVREHDEAGLALRAVPLEREVTAHIRPILVLLAAAGMLLLAVACANAATLLLVRFMARRREIAVRRALGAGDAAVLRPLLLESAFVAFGGTIAGVLLAGPAIRLLLRLEPGIVPRTAPLAVDTAVVLVALAAAVFLTLACGLAPALLVMRGHAPAMLGTQRTVTTPGAQRVWRSVVLIQAAAAFVLLYSSAALLGTLARLERAAVGFAQEGVMTARVTLPFVRYPGPDRWVEFFRELEERMRSAGNVAAVGLTSDLPMDGDLTLEPYAPAELATTSDWGAFTSLSRIVTPGYFTAAGVPLRAGRSFTDADRDGAPDVVVVDEALAEQLAVLAAGPVIGRRLVVTVHEFRAGYRVTQRPAEIVGIVGTVAHEHPDAAPPGTIYMPHAQYPLWSMVVTTRGPAGRTPDIAVTRNTLREMDAQLPLSSVRPLRAVVDQTLAPTRFVLALIGILCMAVIALTAAGLFGMVADAARQRRRELGVRLAVGATPRELSLRMLRAGVALAALGMIPGALLAPGAARILERGVAGVGGFAPGAFVAAALALLCLAALACFLPAWSAGRVDPMATLREE